MMYLQNWKDRHLNTLQQKRSNKEKSKRCWKQHLFVWEKDMFYKGVDISSLLESENNGLRLYDTNGMECNGLKLCKDNGVNSIRLRIWNEPSNVKESRGYCDLEHTVLFGKRIKKENLHFLLDFHYSDFWADPGNQTKPKAWKDLHGEALEKAVYDYTRMVLERLKDEGCLPDMVQIGNEIRSGMLFPDGEVPAYEQLTNLINAGIRATRDVSRDIQIMIHLDQGGRYEYLKEWFDNVIDAGLLDFDIIGISFYAFWHGTFLDLKNSMEALAKRYKKPIIIAETAHPWRRSADGFVTEEQEEIAGFCAGIKEQVQVLRLIMNITASITDNMGQGVYYWEPLVVPMKGQGSWGNNMGVLSLDGKALPGFAEFKFERNKYDPQEVEKIYQIKHKPFSMEDAKRDAYIAESNLVVNADFALGEESWEIHKDSCVSMEINREEGFLLLDSRQNFNFRISQQVSGLENGIYCMGVFYRGTNTTNVDVRFFEEHVQNNEKCRNEKRIYPTDDGWMIYEIRNVSVTEGKVCLGIDIVSPPVTGKIKKFFLYKIDG